MRAPKGVRRFARDVLCRVCAANFEMDWGGGSGRGATAEEEGGRQKDEG